MSWIVAIAICALALLGGVLRSGDSARARTAGLAILIASVLAALGALTTGVV